MHCGGDACVLEGCLYLLTVLHSDGVLCPGAGVARFDGGRGSGAGPVEHSSISLCDLLAQLQFFVEDFQFDQQDGRLQGVETAVDADADVVVPPILSVAGNLADNCGQVVVVGENGAAIAVASQGLAGKEAGGRHSAEVAGFAAFIGGAKALRGILDDRKIVFFGYGIDGVEIGALPVQGNRDNRLGSRGDGGFEFRWIEVEGLRVNIHIHRSGTEHGDSLGGGDEGETGSDDFILGADAKSHLGNLQGIGSVSHGDAVLGAGVGGEAFFQFGHFGAEDVAAMGQDTLDGGVDLVFDARLLGGQIDKGNHGCIRVSVLSLSR